MVLRFHTKFSFYPSFPSYFLPPPIFSFFFLFLRQPKLDHFVGFNALLPSDAVRKQKNILEDLFSSALSQFKKYYPSGNLKFNNLGISQSIKLRILVEKNPYNFSPKFLLEILWAVRG